MSTAAARPFPHLTRAADLTDRDAGLYLSIVGAPGLTGLIHSVRPARGSADGVEVTYDPDDVPGTAFERSLLVGGALVRLHNVDPR